MMIFLIIVLRKKYSITLWNKIFSTKLCKKAFSYISEEYLPKAQDVYTYFIISFLLKVILDGIVKSIIIIVLDVGQLAHPQLL